MMSPLRITRPEDEVFAVGGEVEEVVEAQQWRPRDRHEDPMGHFTNRMKTYVFPAWGSRSIKKSQKKKEKTPEPSRTPVTLPRTARGIDPTTRSPSRSAGSWTLTPPYNHCYGYYKKYGTSPRHGYPSGAPPSPIHVYSTGPTPTYG